jgi:purine-cytosine permease-like protein
MRLAKVERELCQLLQYCAPRGAELAVADALLNSAKLGVLGASIVAAAIGLLALTWLTAPRRASSKIPLV